MGHVSGVYTQSVNRQMERMWEEDKTRNVDLTSFSHLSSRVCMKGPDAMIKSYGFELELYLQESWRRIDDVIANLAVYQDCLGDITYYGLI